MLKRIVFDIDNTLILWKEKYEQDIVIAANKLHYPCDEELKRKVIDAVRDYEAHYNKYDKKDLLILANQHLGKTLPDNFVDAWLLEQAPLVDCDEEIVDVVKYLASKYEIVALTNWFTESQTRRLEKAGLLKYITKVYGADTFLNKPNEEGFLKAIDTHQPSECMMIGDNIRCDIEPAHKLGMQVLYYDYKNKKDGNNYPTFNEFKQLKDRL